MAETLRTPRLRLRTFEYKDVEDLFAIASNPNVASPAGWKVHEHLSQSGNIITLFQNQDFEWAMEEMETNKVIGSISISKDLQDEQEFMIGFLVAQDKWNQGFAFEGVSKVLEYLNQIGMKHINAYHYIDNNRSKELIKKLGFLEEQYIVCGFQNDQGMFHDVIKYKK